MNNCTHIDDSIVNKCVEKPEKQLEKDVNEGIISDPFCIDSDTIYPFRVSSKGIEKHIVTKDTELKWAKITSTPFIITCIGENLDDNANSNEKQSIKLKLKYKSMTGKINSMYIDPTDVLTSDIKKLSNIGLNFPDTKTKELREYASKLLQTRIIKEDVASKNGWYKNDTVLVTGNKQHTATGTDNVVQLTEFLKSFYTEKGDKKLWIEKTSSLFGFELVHFRGAAMVAGFIKKFFPVDNWIVHNYYESGGFKTGMLSCLMSMIGNPRELMQDACSTKVGVEKLLEFTTGTPVSYDETSNNSEFDSLVYLIRNGKGKGRGTKDRGVDRGSNFDTVVQTTGENPLTKGMNTNTGKQVGVIEVYEGLKQMDEVVVKGITDTISKNYGHFLNEIAEIIFRDKDEFPKLYKMYNERFGIGSGIFSSRVKAYFVVMTIAGDIFEEVLERNGIESMDAFEICKKYYEKTVNEDPTRKYGDRALEWVHSWTMQNKHRFEYSQDCTDKCQINSAMETLGYIKPDSIFYPEHVLKEAMEKSGWNYEKAKEDWKAEYLIPLKEGEVIKSWVNRATFNKIKIKGLNIAKETLEKVSGMDTIISDEPAEPKMYRKDGSEMHLNRSSPVVKHIDDFEQIEQIEA